MGVMLVCAGMGIGGAERIVVELARDLRRAGEPVTVAAAPGALDRALAAAGARRVALRDRGRSPVAAAAAAVAIAAAVRRDRPRLLHAHNVRAAALALAAARLAQPLRPPPVLATFHGVEPADDRAAAAILRRVQALACVSEELRDRLRAAGPLPERTVVVPNGVDVPRFAVPRTRMAAELGLGPGPVAAAVGRLEPVKGIDRLLAAWPEVLQRVPEASALVVGDGSSRRTLEEQARSLGIAGRVRFVGARDDAPRLLACADVLVVPSRSEGMPLAALEAMAAGVPVVATAAGGLAAFAREGAAVVTESAAPAALGGQIADLLLDAPRRARIGAAGRAAVQARHSTARMLAAYRDLYRSLA
jgi:glycosyltransferase involved in cell wall biosynthesis